MKKFILGIMLICVASAILLVSDWGQRQRRAGSVRKRIAVFQFASRQVLDDTVAGIVEGLRESGYENGRNAELTFFNAEGNSAELITASQAIVDGGFDLAVTASTPCLQALAHANRDGRINHVFCTVTDPFTAGVGIKSGAPGDRPHHLAGLGTFQPVTEIFRLAKQIKPDLARVGVVWCPGETSSQECLNKARPICRELGIQLEEITVDSTIGVLEAARAVVARDVQALWVGGDNVVEQAQADVIKAAREAGIPVFSHAPLAVQDGMLFTLGADYYDVGREAGRMGGRILSGADPARESVQNIVPRQLAINLVEAARLRPPWALNDDLRRQAALTLDEKGLHRRSAPLSRRQNFSLISYNDSPLAEESTRGLMAGLADAGLVEGRDYIMKRACAQGNMSLLPELFKAAATRGTDLYLVLSTPTLQAAIQQVTDRPVVFTLVADPVVAGAGRSDNNHLPNVTGVYTVGPYEDMAALLQEHYPKFRRIGTLFCPSEANSVTNKELLLAACRKKGIELVCVPAETSSDLSTAAQALCARRIDVLVQVIDNMSAAGFNAIPAEAGKVGVPVFCFISSGVRQGAALALCRDYYDMGHQTAGLAARIARGAPPGMIPFVPPAVTKLVISRKNAAQQGLSIPPKLLSQADEVQP